jgi:hypothetical protein
MQQPFATTPRVSPYHHISATKRAPLSSGRAKHVPSSCLRSSMTTTASNETAINGRINTGQQTVRLAAASDSCKAMGLNNPWLSTNLGSLQSIRPAAPRPGVVAIMFRTKTGLPQIMPLPKPSSPRASFSPGMGLQEARVPARGRPRERLRSSSPLIYLHEPTVNCSFGAVLALRSEAIDQGVDGHARNRRKAALNQ